MLTTRLLRLTIKATRILILNSTHLAWLISTPNLTHAKPHSQKLVLHGLDLVYGDRRTDIYTTIVLTLRDHPKIAFTVCDPDVAAINSWIAG